jgi:hypothetical protein
VILESLERCLSFQHRSCTRGQTQLHLQTAIASLIHQGAMKIECSHLGQIQDVVPSALGCEECLKSGSPWVHLRLCRICGHVGCCDDSPHRHARQHFHATKHPIIEGYDPPEGWGYCWVDSVTFSLGSRTTPQRGPIPRYV